MDLTSHPLFVDPIETARVDAARAPAPTHDGHSRSMANAISKVPHCIRHAVEKDVLRQPALVPIEVGNGAKA